MPHVRLTQQEFNRQLWRAILPPLLLLAAHAAIIGLLLVYWLQMNSRSRQADLVLARTNDVERLFVSMETGIRGYLLWRREEFLAPYLRAKGRLNEALRELRQRVRDDPAQSQRLHALEALIRKWESIVPAGVAEAPFTPDHASAQIEQRHRIMEEVRTGLQEMILSESERKTTLRDQEERAASMAVTGGVTVSILVGIGLALVNRRTVLRLSSHYQQALDDQAASNQQFLDLAEAIPQLIWITDGHGRSLYYNRAWADCTGCAPETLATEGWGAMLHPEDRTIATQRWEHALTTGEPFESEYRVRTPHAGTYRWYLCRAVPIMDRQGNRVRWFGSCTDIDAKKQADRERESVLLAERTARNDLLRASRIKDQFLATLSHELRTPMSAILGWVRLLHDPTIRAEKLDRALEAIETNARAQARLIDDLLDMSRIISGKLALKAEMVDLRQIVRQALDSVALAAQERGVALVAEIDETGSMRVPGDPARLQQIVWNLLTNAIKFTDTGGRITLSLSRAGRVLRIVVRDTGQGICPDFLPYVFDRFRQADGSTTRRQGGLGLGLAIVRHLVSLHGGKVTAHSDGVGRGAEFTVELHEYSVPATPDWSDRSEIGRPLSLDNALLAGKRVLVVDDDRESAAITQTILSRAGAVVEVVHSADAALDALEDSAYDAMLSDIAMPEVDGYTLMHRVRAMPSETAAIPAVALTAFARQDDRDAALRAGYDAHTPKPIAPDELLLVVAGVLTRRRPSASPR